MSDAKKDEKKDEKAAPQGKGKLLAIGGGITALALAFVAATFAVPAKEAPLPTLAGPFVGPITPSKVQVNLNDGRTYLVLQLNLLHDAYSPDYLTQRASDVLLSLRSQWTPSWYGYAQAQFSPDRREFVRTVVGGRYTPGPLRTLTAAYRQQRDATSRLSEQLDLGWQWPLSWGTAPADGLPAGQWYAVGRLNYSLTESKPVDVVAGFEYDAGCWIGRVVLERLQTGRTEANQRVLFQLEFNGLTRLGPNALQSLRENVPRYQYLREQINPPSRFQNHD